MVQYPYMKNSSLKAFIIGSSFPAIIWPFLYLGIASYLNPESSFEYSLVPITLPFVFGFMNVLQLKFVPHYKNLSINARYWLIGLLYGLGLSLYGNFEAQIPVELFQLPDTPIQYIVIPVAMALYAFVWRFIIKNLNHLFSVE